MKRVNIWMNSALSRISQLIISNTQVVPFLNIFWILYKYKVYIPILYDVMQSAALKKEKKKEMKLDFSKQSFAAQNCGKKLGQIQSH